MKLITLAHGAGGSETRELIDDIFAAKLGNSYLDEREDSAVIEPRKYAVSTDGFTVSPLIFKGGDIGKLAVAGSCNDVAMMGARPAYLTASFILEEGLDIEILRLIVSSFASELAANGAQLISADTKVVPRGAAGGGVFITTTALGVVERENLGAKNLQLGDYILASGSAGDHGAAIFAAREGIDLAGDLASDCASLWGLVSKLIAADLPIICMRDATRGGLAAVSNEWAAAANVPLTLDEKRIVVRREVQGACELMGFEPYALANEGMMIVAVRGEAAAVRAMEIMRGEKLGANAAIIGSVSGKHSGKVVLNTPHNTARFLELPSGELLPRIC